MKKEKNIKKLLRENNEKLMLNYNIETLKNIKAQASQMFSRPTTIYPNFSMYYRQMPALFMEVVSKIGPQSKRQFLEILNRTYTIISENQKPFTASAHEEEGNYYIQLPNTIHSEFTFADYAHEVGHTARFENHKVKNYFEYREVLPMLLEFLAIEHFYEPDAKNIFLLNRINIHLELVSYLNQDRIYQDVLNEDALAKELMIKTASYIQSLEYSINMIDKLKRRRYDTLKAIEAMILGYETPKSLAKPLDINTEGTPKLIYEYKIRR